MSCEEMVFDLMAYESTSFFIVIFLASFDVSDLGTLT